MKYLFYIIIGLATIVLVYFGVFNREQSQRANHQPAEQSANTSQGGWETKTDDQPPVTINITPIEFGRDAKVWKLTVAFDTHSGSLDDDLLKVTSLVDNEGSTYQPISWEGQGPGGHHREGVLTFGALDPAPLYVELIIKNVGGVSGRSFKWNIE